MKKAKAEAWKLKILKTDRNETRLHTSTGLVSIFYKDSEGLKTAYRWAKKNLTKEVALGIVAEYKRMKMQGA